MKKLTILLFTCLIFFTVHSLAHVKHYKKVKHLKYSIFLNNELIGYHTFDFSEKNEKFIVNGAGSFKVSKLGINLMKYKSISQAIYKENQLIKFNSRTTQNDKEKYVKIELNKNSLNVHGSSFKGKTEKNIMISSLWNHEIVTKNKQISSVSGRIIDQKVKFLGKKKITVNNKVFETLNFHIFSNNSKAMKDKKLNIKIWYDADTLLWVKASYEKLGKWEYRISEVQY
tara:strand:+ start:412 stop:1095 length:684 start_codon:yes stop_codon:yes gene_type:complete